jgi:AbrB family looped-hinge helix DNA binding protein
VNPPHGPFKIGANRQITIPAELLKRIDLAPGDSVYVAMADDVEGSLIVVPVERLVSWIDAGRRSFLPSPPESVAHDAPGDEQRDR